MDNTSVGMLVLEMNKPVLARGSVNPRALMRTVDLRLSLGQSHVLVVRTKGIARTQDNLPSVFHSTSRRHDIIISVALIELGALDGGLVLMSVIYNARWTCDSRSVGRHGSHEEHRLHSRSRTSATMREISLSVLVPERAAVNHSLTGLHAYGSRPCASWILCLCHKQSLVGVAPIDIKPSVVMANGRSPHIVAMLNTLVPVEVGAAVFWQHGIVVQ